VARASAASQATVATPTDASHNLIVHFGRRCTVANCFESTEAAVGGPSGEHFGLGYDYAQLCGSRFGGLGPLGLAVAVGVGSNSANLISSSILEAFSLQLSICRTPSSDWLRMALVISEKAGMLYRVRHNSTKKAHRFVHIH
jgi:hypothetical protein